MSFMSGGTSIGAAEQRSGGAAEEKSYQHSKETFSETQPACPSIEGKELILGGALARRSREAVEGKMGSHLGNRAPA